MSKRKPNILWIFCDQLRADALECYGNRCGPMRTPHIDALAERGTRFTRCFCDSPACVPSRTSILTGLPASATGVYDNNCRVIASEKLSTLPGVFARAGYRTANIGKNHVHDSLLQWQYNVDVNEATLGKDLYRGNDPKHLERLKLITMPRVPVAVGGRWPADEPYPGDAHTELIVKWLAEHGGNEPFFLRASFVQPHNPVITPPPFDDLYNDLPFPTDGSPHPSASRFQIAFSAAWGNGWFSEEERRLIQVQYYGLVAWLDRQIGMMVDALKSRGEADNTLIILSADHGQTLGEDGAYGKFTFQPAGHRIPLIIAGPDVPPGRVDDTLCLGLDLGRSLFGLTGVEAPDQFQGRDLFNSDAPETICSVIGFGERDEKGLATFGADGWPRRWCIRSRQYRYDKSTRLAGRPLEGLEQDPFFCDVLQDPAERRNLVYEPQYRQIIRELDCALEESMKGKP